MHALRRRGEMIRRCSVPKQAHRHRHTQACWLLGLAPCSPFCRPRKLGEGEGPPHEKSRLHCHCGGSSRMSSNFIIICLCGDLSNNRFRDLGQGMRPNDSSFFRSIMEVFWCVRKKPYDDGSSFVDASSCILLGFDMGSLNQMIVNTNIYYSLEIQDLLYHYKQ